MQSKTISKQGSLRMANFKVEKKNEVYLKVTAEPHIHYELHDYFCFDVPNAKFMPAYRNGWDGKIRLYSPGTGELYVGLFKALKEFADDRGYNLEVDDNKFFGSPTDTDDITPQQIYELVKSYNLPFEARDYQLKGIYEALK